MAELKVRATLDGSNYQSGIMRLGGLADGLKSRLAAAFTVGAVVAGVRKVMAYADSVEELAQRAGISTKALQEWSFAAKQNGADAEKLIGFIERLTAAAQDMKNAAGFSKLGISPAGMTPEQLFSSVQSKTRGRGSPEILAIMDSLGMDIRKTGRMINVLQTDLDAAAVSANNLGAVMDDVTIRRLAAFNDQISIVGQVLLASFAPALMWTAEKSLELLGAMKGMVDWISTRTSNMGKADVGFGAAMITGNVSGMIAAMRAGGRPISKWREGGENGLSEQADNAFAEQVNKMQELINLFTTYKPPAAGTIQPATGGTVPKFKSNADSLISVGNFLGAGRSAIDSLQKEANRIAKENGRKLDEIAENTGKAGGTIEVP